MADKLEQEYQGAVATGQWQCKVVVNKINKKQKFYDPMQVVLTSGDWVMLHSPEVTQKYIKSDFRLFFFHHFDV